MNEFIDSQIDFVPPKYLKSTKSQSDETMQSLEILILDKFKLNLQTNNFHHTPPQISVKVLNIHF